jgi:hypothetical protein
MLLMLYTCLLNADTFRTRLPYELPAGQYLLRLEKIGLDIKGQADFYVACAQIEVVEGGNGVWPVRGVEIPGHIKEADDSLTVDIRSPKVSLKS